ncbi:MAG: hypothetical protein ABH852_00480 [Methanobacteriota archaeon]
MKMTDEEYIKEIFEPNSRSFPELLTIEESDDLENFKTFAWEGSDGNRRAALEFAKRVGGIVYTQIDGDDGSVAYDLGFHLVNRTGIYAVTWMTKRSQQQYPRFVRGRKIEAGGKRHAGTLQVQQHPAESLPQIILPKQAEP